MHATPQSAIPMCRSAFAEEFRDAYGFGWKVDNHPIQDLKLLISKKVRSFQ
jgi:hypothetical protein